jgi:hypothetical protein
MNSFVSKARKATASLLIFLMTVTMILPSAVGAVTDSEKPLIVHTPVTSVKTPQNITVTAQVYDNVKATDVKLYYKKPDDAQFTVTSMTYGITDPNGSVNYSALIPQSVTQGVYNVQYYIEATDGTNVTRHPEQPDSVHTIQVGQMDGGAGPYLLITEAVFNSRDLKPGVTESFEYVELYNNSNRPIPLKEYTLLYGYYNNNAPVRFDITDDKILQPGQTIVLWNYKEDQGAAIQNFNANYGTSLTEDQIIKLIPGYGFANEGGRNFTVVTDTGTIVSKAIYNNDNGYTSTDASDNKDHRSNTYAADPSGAPLMLKLGKLQTPTPGTVLLAQIPDKRMMLPDDFLKPVIEHMIPMGSAKPQDLTISAKVTDDQLVSGVKLFYKKLESETFTPVEMTAGNDHQYSAVIPKDAMTETAKLQYYIEATDGTNTNRSPDAEGKLHEIQIFTSDKPLLSSLLITEMVPANVGNEDYEFVEVYNNTTQAVNLEDYKLLYENRGGATTPIDIDSDFVLPAKQTAVLWLQSYSSKGKPVTDFNNHYNVNVDSSKVVPVYWNGLGMPDAEEGRILIAADAAYPLSHAADGIISQAWFSVTGDEAIDGKSVVYEYPKDGSNRMFLRGFGQSPTPGDLINAQVPNEPINVLADAIKPVIEHTPFPDYQEIADLTMEMKVTDNQSVKQVNLYFKRNGASEYKRVNMLDSGEGKYKSETIAKYDFLNAEFLDYYVTATDGFQTVSTLDNGGTPFRLTFARSSEPLSLNIEHGEFIRGSKVVEGLGQAHGNVLSLSVDGQPLVTQPSMQDDAYIRFEAHDMQASFKNGLFINDVFVRLLPGVDNYKSMILPLPKQYLKPGANKITLTSGNTVDPKALDGNNDDYRLQNVQILNWNGDKLAITAKTQSDKGVLANVTNPEARILINDGIPQIHYTIQLPNDAFPGVAHTLDSTKLADGEHTFQVAAASGETLQTQAVIDNTAPVIGSLSVEDGKSYKGQVKLEAVISDATSGVGLTEATLDGQPVTLPAAKYLEAGTHAFEVKATDKAGNETRKVVSFIAENRHPDKPSDPQPFLDEAGVGQHEANLSVKVTDPNGDMMDVTFYKAYKHDFAGDSDIKAYSNSTDREPPLELVPAGESEFSTDAVSNVKEKDGKYFVTDSDGQFPYHRFDFTLTDELAPEDEVEVVWDGHSLSDRQVTMYTWNYNTNKWVRATSGIGSQDFQLKAKVNVGDMVKDKVLHVLIQDLFPSPDDVDFTFAWVSDTQYYSDSYPHIYRSMMKYLVEQKEEKKIIYSIHTGDLVDDWDRPDEWVVANESMKYLDDAGMNYGVVAGNHDVHFTDADYSEYYKYFGRNRFEKQPTYGGDLNNNRDHYDLVSQNGQDFLIMYLGWDVQEETVKWANEVLKQHPNRYAIIATHSYITPSGAYGGDGYGAKIWSEIVAPNKNVFMVLCGHFHGVAYNVKHAPDGRTVVEMLSDYQSGLEGGQGYIRFLQFDLDNQKIHVNTYSPYMNDENYYDEPGKDEFDIEYPVRPVAKQVATDYIGVNVYTKESIGSNMNVKSGTTATVQWDKLLPNRRYSWYALVTDGFGGSAVSEVWRFQAGKHIKDPKKEK